MALFFKDYRKSKGSASLRVENILVRENTHLGYQLKRLNPLKSFEGYSEIYFSCDSVDLQHDEWEDLIDEANVRASSQLEDDFHLNKNIHFSTAEDVWLDFQGISDQTDESIVVTIRTVDLDILKYVIDFILYPVLMRRYQESQSRIEKE